MQAPSSSAADFDRLSSAVAWICAVVVLASAITWYWLVSLSIFLVLLALPVASAAAFAFVLSGWSLIRRGKWRPVAALTVSVGAVLLLPLSTVAMHIDFHLKRPAMSAFVSEQSAASSGGEDTLLWETYLTVPGPATGGEVFVVVTGDCQAVFFPTFWGIPDGAEGFLHAPDCFDPAAFPGGRFGVRVWHVRSLGQDWWRIGGA